MRPSSVAPPVATTTARPVPDVTNVPPKAMPCLSPTAASSGTGAGAFCDGHRLAGERRFLHLKVSGSQ